MALLFVGRREQAFAPLLERAGFGTGAFVLDAGCGTGWLSRHIATRVGPRGRVLGIDPSRGGIAYARAQAEAHEEHVVASMTHVPLPEASVDGVITSLVLHHVEPGRQSEAFAELARVLRPGGRLFVVELVRPGSTWSRALFGWQGCVRASLSDAHLRTLAVGAGFTDIETGQHWRWLRWLSAVR